MPSIHYILYTRAKEEDGINGINGKKTYKQRQGAIIAPRICLRITLLRIALRSLHQDFLSAHDVDATLHLLKALACEVIDGPLFRLPKGRNLWN